MTSMALTLKILSSLMLIFCTSVSTIPITSDFYRYNGELCLCMVESVIPLLKVKFSSTDSLISYVKDYFHNLFKV